MTAGLSLSRMSLWQGEGVEEVYHMFREPETLPNGYRAHCTVNSNATLKNQDLTG